jgi:hypothetical protein
MIYFGYSTLRVEEVDVFLSPPIASLHWGLLTFRPAVCRFYLTQGFATEPKNMTETVLLKNGL